SEHEALVLTKLSKRQLAGGRSRGELASYGRPRSRTYKRGDLVAWLDSRRMMPSDPIAAQEADIDRRIKRLERERGGDEFEELRRRLMMPVLFPRPLCGEENCRDVS